MFREMRRKKQLLSKEAVEAVLSRNTNGVLACLGDEDYPYAVPLSYAYLGGKLYFHTAKSGHKVDALKKHTKASFAVVDEDTIVSAEYTSYFRSVIVFGRIRFAEGEERTEGLRALVEKYSGDQPEEAKRKEIAECTQADIMILIPEHVTGKEAIELVRTAQKKDQ